MLVDDCAIVRVSDSGRGFSNDPFSNEIFENENIDHTNGYGFGLSLAKKLIESIGANIVAGNSVELNGA